MNVLYDKHGRIIGSKAISTTDRIASNADERAQEARKQEIAKTVGEKIAAEYPGHFFYVAVDGGCVLISNPTLTGPYRHVIHLKRLAADPNMRCVVRAAGEILERYNLKRGAKDRDSYRELLKHIPVRVAPLKVRQSDGSTRTVTPDALR